MLVISRDLVLTSALFPPWSPIVGWRNKVTAANIGATTAADGFPAANLATASTAELWQALDTTEQYLTVTLAGPEEMDYVGLARHNLGTAVIPVSIEGFIDGDWEELVADVILGDDEAVLFRFELQSLSAIRVRLQTGNAAASIACVYVGKLTILPPHIPVDFTPLKFGRVFDGVSDESEAGGFLGSIVFSQFRESTVNLIHLEPDWYREEMDPWIAVTPYRPFFFAWDPLHYPDEVGFARIKFGTNPRPVIHDSAGRMRIELQMRGIV